MKRTAILILALALAIGFSSGQAIAQSKILKISNGVNEQHQEC